MGVSSFKTDDVENGHDGTQTPSPVAHCIRDRPGWMWIVGFGAFVVLQRIEIVSMKLLWQKENGDPNKTGIV